MLQGCIWHGCPVCYKKRGDKVPNTAETFEDRYQATLTKAKFLRDEGYNVVEMWSCQMRDLLKEDRRLSQFCENLEGIPPPMDHRAALRGGKVTLK